MLRVGGLVKVVLRVGGGVSEGRAEGGGLVKVVLRVGGG